jgi:hypothetical protein
VDDPGSVWEAELVDIGDGLNRCRMNVRIRIRISIGPGTD